MRVSFESAGAAAHRAVKRWARGRGLRALLQDLPAILAGAPAAAAKLGAMGRAKWAPANDAGAGQVKKCFHRACRVVHPDRLAGFAVADAKLCEQVFCVLSAQYEAFRGD